MIGSALAMEADATGATADGPWRALGRAALVVTGFWWLATGLLVAMQRDGVTRNVAAVVATLLAAWGTWLVVRSRDDMSARAIGRSFLGGALLWAWISATFYGGWIVGLFPDPGVVAARGWTLALEAIRATIYSELLALAVLGMLLVACVPHRNRAGLWSFVAFVGAHQVAKLNVFFGVENPGTRFLPVRLAHLEIFFGPPENSPVLYLSIVALSLLTAWLLGRVWRSRRPGERYLAALLGVLLGLAALEHAFLAFPLHVPLWDVFLDWRGH